MKLQKRTKIVATLGPASDKPGMLDKMIRAGMDVVRLNFSHGGYEDHKHRADMVRERARANGRQIGVIADLQGPKIRIAAFQKKKVFLQEGGHFILDMACADDAGDDERVGVTYKPLAQEVYPDDELLLDDGRIVLKVEHIEGDEIHCKITVGGDLSNSKGINRKGGGLSAAALTEKDKQDIKYAAMIDADYLAISFPRSAADVHEARRLLREAGGTGGIIAKIERAEAMEDLDNIMMASDAVMIARGDLGVEIGDEALPPAQKDIINKARDMKLAVITATQMMESMISNQIPTRAEVFDVANAVFDGTDAVMLSAETAAGKHPDVVIAAMARICRGAEKQSITKRSSHRIDTNFLNIDEAVAMSSMYAANHLHVKAIASLTESGSTPLWMSRIRSGIPIYALSRNIATRRKVTLYRGVYPISFDVDEGGSPIETNRRVISELRNSGTVSDGDYVIIAKGDRIGVAGGTNTMKIVRVGSIEEISTESDAPDNEDITN